MNSTARPFEGDPQWEAAVAATKARLEARQAPQPTTGSSFSSSRATGVAAPRVSAPKPPVKRASERQCALIKRLGAERVVSDEDRPKVEYVQGGGVPTSKGASALITTLLAAPRVPRAAAAPAREIDAPGLYRAADGTLLRVYWGKQSKVWLVTRADLVEALEEDEQPRAEFTYLGSAARCLPADAMRLTPEEAAQFGTLTGTCAYCATDLDDPVSVARGIGPICFAKYC